MALLKLIIIKPTLKGPLISQAINCEFPQDDIVEMMQTTMRKPAE
jgi:hypothetical protein